MDMRNRFEGLKITIPPLAPLKPTFLEATYFQQDLQNLLKVVFKGAEGIIIGSNPSIPQIFFLAKVTFCRRTYGEQESPKPSVLKQCSKISKTQEICLNIPFCF